MGILSEMWVVFGAKTDKLKAGTREAEQTLGKFGQSVNAIGAKIAAAFAVERIVSFAWEAAKLAGEVQGVKYAFDALNKPGLLSELRKATHNTVSDLELMKAAVQANNFKIPLEQMGSLLKFAHLRAQQTGQSVDYLVNSIVMGIGRKSPLILDNLGISAVALREKFKGIEVEAVGVSDVARAVGEIADEAMKKSGAAIETTTMKIEQMKAAWQNTKVVIGEILVPAVEKLVGLLQKAAMGWQNILSPGALSSDIAVSEIENIKKSLDGLSQSDAIKKLQTESERLKIASSIVGEDKSLSKTQRNQLIDSYAKVDTWIKTIFYDTKKVDELRTHTLTLTTKEKAIADEQARLAKQKADAEEAEKKRKEALIKQQEELLKLSKEIQANLGQHIGLGMSRTEALPLPVPPESKIKIPKSEGNKEDYLTNYQSAFSSRGLAIPELEDAAKVIEDLETRKQKAFDKTAASAQKSADIILGAFSDVTNIKSFANAVKNAAKQMILAYIAEATAANIAKAVKSGKTWWGALIQGAAAAAGTAAVFSAIPSFAQGGFVKSPTLAMVGDNPSGKGEFILPWEKLNQLGGGAGKYEFKLKGYDLYATLEKQKQHLNRVS